MFVDCAGGYISQTEVEYEHAVSGEPVGRTDQYALWQRQGTRCSRTCSEPGSRRRLMLFGSRRIFETMETGKGLRELKYDPQISADIRLEQQHKRDHERERREDEANLDQKAITHEVDKALTESGFTRR